MSIRWKLLTTGVVVVASACGSPADDSVRSQADAPVTADTPNESLGQSPADAPAQADTTATSVLPGEDFDAWPNPGDTLAVAGIQFDGQLPVRELPGSGATQLATLAPTATGVPATGAARLIEGDGIWYQVSAGGVTGWADGSHLKYLGPTADVTASVTSGLGQEPTAPTMLELGQTVADYVASGNGDVPPDVVVVVPPTDGPTGTTDRYRDV